ncbi:MAG TPA: glycosyltransferase [Acidobacteriota bacterium]|nr:glycosyltransferase [Acidobacteriota bacterium]
MPGLPDRLADFRNHHRGAAMLVCGCGASLKDIPHPQRWLTIGVNDVGRLFHPTYLVVLNPRRQFSGDRFHYVEESRARAVFSQLDLQLPHTKVVRIRLGDYAGTNLDDPHSLPHTRNSPYVALCLALHMGATRIGLVGVDFTDHHFFNQSGPHPLNGQLEVIDRQYGALASAWRRRGVEIVNLSRQSRLTSIPMCGWEDFLDTSPQPAPRLSGGRRARESETIAIERQPPGIVGDFLDSLAETVRQLGYRVTGDVAGARQRKDVISVVWNGRRHSSQGPTLYCEHAWLPRWEYQISPSGINADSHLSPFAWDGQPLSEAQEAELEDHLESVRGGGPQNYQYMQTAVAPVQDLPDDFFLVPLQMEWDTNIRRHVPGHLRRMQDLIDFISRSDPPLPLVFKQHPADTRRGHQQLGLTLHRSQDRIKPHREGNIHQLLKSGRCRGIVALNSNVVHDGLIWDIPAVVLGKNIWPRSGDQPFLTALPADWTRLEAQRSDAQSLACRRAYAFYLMRAQWKLDDARDPQRVESLLALARKAVPTPSARSAKAGRGVELDGGRSETKSLRVSSTAAPATANHLTVNVVARNHGWVFEDLKEHFLAAASAGIRVLLSERPRSDADRWIFIRTQEAVSSPDPSRTLVQIHDNFDNGLYRRGGRRHCVASCRGLCLIHPQQRGILERNGVDLSQKKILERPIGALKAFQLRESLYPRFTVGWVGRPVRHFGREVKRIDAVVDALLAVGGELRVILLGERLEAQHQRLAQAGIECHYLHRSRHPLQEYPRHYAEFDCLAIFSSTEAGPLCLFEALACGVPVVSSPVGWAPQLIREGRNGLIAESIDDLARAICDIRGQREDWFQRRLDIRQSLGGHTLESWITANLHLAASLPS